MFPNDENLRVLQDVTAVLIRLEIPYALGGSWASSFHGSPRFTHDADLTVEPFPGKEERLCASFGDDYYVSLQAIQEAILRRTSFNILNMAVGFKVDLFVRKERPFDLSVLQRSRPEHLPDAPEHSIQLVSPEDVILLKLEWYRIGNETSERQWSDVLGVLRVQGNRLDEAYLDHWAAELKVDDLLARARQEIGG